MRLRYVGLILLLFVFSFSYCQNNSKAPNIWYPKLALGISPSAFLNWNQALQFSVDVRVNNSINFSTEVGYIVNSLFSSSVNGYRLRPSIEFKVYSYSNLALQLGIFALQKNYYEDRLVRVAYSDYFQEFPIIRQKNLIGGGFSFAFLSRLNENINIETGVGLGLGTLKVSDNKSIPNSIPDSFLFIFLYDFEGEYDISIFYFNINISYALLW